MAGKANNDLLIRVVARLASTQADVSNLQKELDALALQLKPINIKVNVSKSQVAEELNKITTSATNAAQAIGNLSVVLQKWNTNNDGRKQKDANAETRKAISLLTQYSNLLRRVETSKWKNSGTSRAGELKDLAKEIKKQYDAYSELYESGTIKKSDVDGRKFKLAQLANAFANLNRLIDEENKLLAANKTAFMQYDKLQSASSIWFRNNQGYVNANPDAVADFNSALATLDIEKQTIPLKEYQARLEALTTTFNRMRIEAAQAGIASQTAMGKLGAVLKQFATAGLGLRLWTLARRTISQMIANVRELNLAMTELKKVTDETDSEYERFLTRATQRAKTLGSTLVDVVRATADFARLGYSIGDAETLADAALVYKNVGDGINDITEASESVISTMKAFNVEASDAMSIVDKYNEIGNRFAVSSSGVGVAMKKSASALAYANNSLDESIALVVAANATVQDPEVVGTALKTLSMRIRSSSAELEEAGLETEGMAETTARLRNELLALAGVDIMLDNDSIKSTYQIMTELAAVWEKMSDVEQAAVLELIAGKRMANTAASIIQNIEDAGRAYDISQKSAGSAMAENEKYLNSIQGKIDVMNSTYESLSSHLFDDEAVKAAVTALASLLKTLDKIAQTLGSLPVLIGTLSLALSVMPKARGLMAMTRLVDDASKLSGKRLVLNAYGFSSKGYDITALREAAAPLVAQADTYALTSRPERFGTYKATTAKGQPVFSSYVSGLQTEFNNAFKDSPVVLKEVTRQLDEYNKAMAASGKNLKPFVIDQDKLNKALAQQAKNAQRASFGKNLLNTAINIGTNMLISAAISLIIKGIDALIHRVDNLKNKARDLHAEYANGVNNLENLNKELDETKARIEELEEKGPLTIIESGELKKLKEANEQLDREIKIQEKLNAVNERVAKRAAEKAYKSDKVFVDNKELDGRGSSGMVDDYRGTDSTLLSRADYLVHLGNQEAVINKKIEEAEDKFANSKSRRKDKKEYDRTIENLEKELEENAKNASSTITDLQTTLEILGEDSEIGKEIKAALREYLRTTDPNYVFDEVVNILANPVYENLLNKITEAKNNGETIDENSLKELLGGDIAFAEFEDALDEAGITWVELADTINNTDFSLSVRAIKALEEAMELPKLKEKLNGVAEAYDALSSAAKEYAQSGSISIETFQTLMNLGPEYRRLLHEENGQLVLNAERIKDVTAAYIDQITHKQAIALVDNIAALKSEEEQLKALGDVALETGKNLKQFALNYVVAAYTTGTSNITKPVYEELRRQVEGMFNLADSAKAGIDARYSAAGGSMSEAFSKARATLEHELDMGRISEEQFWNSLEKLRDKYFSGESEEWKNLFREIEKGRAELQEKLLKLQGEAAVKAIEKKIEAKQKEKEQLEEQYEAEDRLFELQKARDRYEAAKRNLNTRVYTADKGWTWVADPKELQDSREALEELERKHAREDAKKAIDDEIEALEELKDKYQEAMDQIGMDLQEHADMLEWLAKFEAMTYEELASYAEEYFDTVVAGYERIEQAKRDAANVGEGGGKDNTSTSKAKSGYVENTGKSQYITGEGAKAINSGKKPKVAYVHGTTVYYKSGTRHSPTSGPAIVDEVGPELIARHNEAGRLTHLELGDTVFPADMTQRLWDLAATGSFALASASRIPVRTNLHEGAFAARQSVSNSNDVVLTGCTFELSNVTDVDSFFGELNRIANRHRRK